MNTRGELIKHLIENVRVLRTQRLKRAFEELDRADFVAGNYWSEAYEDYPIPIGYGQTISQPTTVVFMLELLDVKAGDKVLDVGSGSGWTTALLSKLVGKDGRVFGVEKIPAMVDFGRKNLAKYVLSNAEIRQAGAELGLPSEAPFDKILVSAASQSIPEILLHQLKVPGILVLPVNDTIIQIRKNVAGQVTREIFPGFAFVPLVG